MADRIHHALALDDQADVEVGDEHALAFGQRRREMAAFGRDDRGHAAAAQPALQQLSSGVIEAICSSLSQPVALTTKQPLSSA